MNRPIRILMCAGALLSLLTFARPAQAAGWTHGAPDGGILQAAWEWITGVWHPGSPEQGQRIDLDGLRKSDRSMGIDPDGKPSAATTSTCLAGCDNG